MLPNKHDIEYIYQMRLSGSWDLITSDHTHTLTVGNPACRKVRFRVASGDSSMISITERLWLGTDVLLTRSFPGLSGLKYFRLL